MGWESPLFWWFPLRVRRHVYRSPYIQRVLSLPPLPLLTVTSLSHTFGERMNDVEGSQISSTVLSVLRVTPTSRTCLFPSPTHLSLHCLCKDVSCVISFRETSLVPLLKYRYFDPRLVATGRRFPLDLPTVGSFTLCYYSPTLTCVTNYIIYEIFTVDDNKFTSDINLVNNEGQQRVLTRTLGTRSREIGHKTKR